MQIIGLYIFKTMLGYEVRPTRDTDQWMYRSSTFEGILGYLRQNGYREPPLEIPLIIEAY